VIYFLANTPETINSPVSDRPIPSNRNSEISTSHSETATDDLDIFLHRLESIMPQSVSSPSQAIGSWLSAVGGILLGLMISNAYTGPNESGLLNYLISPAWLSLVGGFLMHSGIKLHNSQNNAGKSTARELLKIEHEILSEMQRRGHFEKSSNI
jgi:hypothetical protein